MIEYLRYADISPDGQHRRMLRIPCVPGVADSVLWIMLNPSTADASTDDPTSSKITKFSRGWGFGSAVIANLFTWRATDPKDLLGKFPSTLNESGADELLLHLARRADDIILAWGVPHRDLLPRAAHVLSLLADTETPHWCLGYSKDRHPLHPLYLPDATQPVLYAP